MRLSVRVAGFLLSGVFIGAAHAGLFDDDEARKAILDLRQRIDAVRVESEQRLNTRLTEESRKTAEDSAQIRRSLLEFQNQIEALRAELASQRGQNEQLAREVSELQRRQKDADQGVEERLRKLEPVKVAVDGREFMADPMEKRGYEDALAAFREVLSLAPDHLRAPEAAMSLANCQIELKDIKSARKTLGVLMKAYPQTEAAQTAKDRLSRLK